MHRPSAATLAGLAGFAAIVLTLSLLLPETFPTARNLLNVTRQVAALATVAFASTLVMATGDFDLSVGSMASLAGTVAAALFVREQPMLVALGAALAMGAAGGALNGLLVGYAGLLPFVATLGTLTMFGGAAFLVSDGKTIFGRAIPQAFGDFARGGVPLDALGLPGLQLPSLVIVALGALLACRFALERMVFGRHLYVIGDNVEAATLAGIRVRRLRLAAYTLCGTGAALAGLMLASRVASANPVQGAGLMLDAIACTFLGMTLDPQGRPRAFGTLVGVATLGLLDNGLTQLGTDSYVREILVGAILVAAVGLSGHARRRASG